MKFPSVSELERQAREATLAASKLRGFGDVAAAAVYDRAAKALHTRIELIMAQRRAQANEINLRTHAPAALADSPRSQP